MVVRFEMVSCIIQLTQLHKMELCNRLEEIVTMFLKIMRQNYTQIEFKSFRFGIEKNMNKSINAKFSNWSDSC